MPTKSERNGKNELVDRLGLTPRRIEQLVNDGVIIANSQGQFDLDENLNRYRVFKQKDLGWLSRQMTRNADDLRTGFQKLYDANSVAQRRALGPQVGPLIGETDDLMRLGAAISVEGKRPLLNHFTNMTIGALLSEYFALLGYEIADDEAPPRRPKTHKIKAGTK